MHGKNKEFQGVLVVDWSGQTSQKGWALIWVLKVGETFENLRLGEGLIPHAGYECWPASR